MEKVLKPINYSFLEVLRNKQHATFMQEFIAMVPRGLYNNLTTVLSKNVEDELENLTYCRKNHYRVKFNSKMMFLRALFAALRSIIEAECKLGTPNAEREMHNYEVHVGSEMTNISFLAGAKGFVSAWTGLSSEAADKILDNIEETIDHADTLVNLMGIEYLQIGNLPPQKKLREATDRFLMAIVRRAQVEYVTLSPNVEEEERLLEQVTLLLNGTLNWMRRVKIAAKNNGPFPDDIEEEIDEEEEENQTGEGGNQTDESENQTDEGGNQTDEGGENTGEQEEGGATAE